MTEERHRGGEGYPRGKDWDVASADTHVDSPVDFAAVQSDDALINAIAGDGSVQAATSVDYELASLLAGWRGELLSTPTPISPTLDEVCVALDGGFIDDELVAKPVRRALRIGFTQVLAGAAAVVAVAIGGLTIFTYDAQPGDALFGVKQAIFGDQARSDQILVAARTDLAEAERRIAAGDKQSAQALLAEIAGRVNGVTKTSDREALQEWLNRLDEQISTEVTEPSVESSVEPEVPLVPSESTTSSRQISTAPSTTADSSTVVTPPSVTSTTPPSPSETTTLPSGTTTLTSSSARTSATSSLTLKP
ncbi:MAG: anti-sigma-D factor RsdA [Mycobacteriaceae bacterium]